MNIEEILDDMDDLLERSRPIPFAAHKAVIDADRMRELLNSAHLNIPAEIKRAKLIDSDCDRIINEAREKAEAIIQDAETRAKRMLSEEAILQEAKQRALDMLTKAQNGSKDIKEAAEKYVNNLLNDAQAYFQNSLQEVQQTKSRIEELKK
ncbi:MAG: vacuolar-type H+-ATPase subunit H [Ruminococcus sp.]|uniref:vacuolar-type H+-ATPase subunit H n=1 Tax=uncultured Ruminococcus sp. TaxID=165186 RepID=UPI00261FF36D|nr:vacuolar-type H+-ATPase subunit H [uncultured Ruminococcus sp.]